MVTTSTRRALGYALVLCFVLTSGVGAADKGDAPHVGRLSDPPFFFSVEVPAGWRVRRAHDAESFWRFSATRPDGAVAVAFYAFHRPGTIELDHLIKLDQRLFTDLGTATASRTIRHYLVLTKAVERTYARNSAGFHRLARFQASGTYAYVMMAAAKSPDFAAAREVFETFTVDVPLSAHIKNTFTLAGVWSWVGGIVVALLAVAVLYLLGKTGQVVRTGVEMKRALRRVRADAAKEGMTVNAKWYRYDRKATWHVCGPAIGWTVAYAILLALLPLKAFLVALVALVVPVLGYLGFFFVPSSDAEAYLPKGL